MKNDKIKCADCGTTTNVIKNTGWSTGKKSSRHGEQLCALCSKAAFDADHK